MDAEYAQVIKGLSQMIETYLHRAASQQYSPSGNVDESDHLIADSSKRAKRLREIRNEIEDIYTGYLNA